MNKIKWNSKKTGFTLTFTNGVKETYSEKYVSNNNFVRISDKKYWLVKSN
jgi:hypothetical protein